MRINQVIWWIAQCLLVLIASFFLVFGISLFIGAYKLDDPFSFIMTVFGSNLMILISAVLLVGLVWRMISVFRLMKCGDLDGSKERDPDRKIS